MYKKDGLEWKIIGRFYEIKFSNDLMAKHPTWIKSEAILHSHSLTTLGNLIITYGNSSRDRNWQLFNVLLTKFKLRLYNSDISVHNLAITPNKNEYFVFINLHIFSPSTMYKKVGPTCKIVFRIYSWNRDYLLSALHPEVIPKFHHTNVFINQVFLMSHYWKLMLPNFTSGPQLPLQVCLSLYNFWWSSGVKS